MEVISEIPLKIFSFWSLSQLGNLQFNLSFEKTAW